MLLSGPRFLRKEPISRYPPLNALPWDPKDVHVNGHGGRGAAPSAAGGLETLELVQGLVEPPLYGRLVAREFGEGVSAGGVPGEGPPKGGGLGLLLAPHLLGSGEGLLMLFSVAYCNICVLHVVVLGRLFVTVGLTLSPLGQLLKALPGEYAGLHPPQAPQPPGCGDYALHEQALQLPAGPQLLP